MDLKAGWTLFDRNRAAKGEAGDSPDRSVKKKGKLDLQAVGLPRLLIIVFAGIFLLILSLPTPAGRQAKTDKSGEDSALTDEVSGEVAESAMENYTKKKEKQLEELLAKADGVGRVQVMITLASSEERITLQNDTATQETSLGNGSEQSREKQSASTESVLVHRDGEDSPYLVRIISPEVEGIVVVAQGADGAVIDAEIIAAVQALFSVEAHKIRVMKMK